MAKLAQHPLCRRCADELGTEEKYAGAIFGVHWMFTGERAAK